MNVYARRETRERSLRRYMERIEEKQEKKVENMKKVRKKLPLQKAVPYVWKIPKWQHVLYFRILSLSQSHFVTSKTKKKKGRRDWQKILLKGSSIWILHASWFDFFSPVSLAYKKNKKERRNMYRLNHVQQI